MPTTLIAVGTIRVGQKSGEKVFEDGDKITGLSKELLADLVRSGVAVTEKRYARIRPESDEDVDIDAIDLEDEDEDEDEGEKTPPGTGS